MSDKESFPARWSRRKRGAARNARGQSRPESTDGGAQSEASAVVPPPGEIQPPFDPASLPPIESIGAGSDIQAFLAAGVPADLTRAALRRAWSSEPAIRDFIGLSENSWDFNAPGGVPGFGPVKAEDIRQLLAQLIEKPEAGDPAYPAAETTSNDESATPASQSRPAAELVHQPSPVREPARTQSSQDHNSNVHDHDPQRSREANAAMQHEPPGHEYYVPMPRRGRGGALPE
jgi:hypothetical protein